MRTTVKRTVGSQPGTLKNGFYVGAFMGSLCAMICSATTHRTDFVSLAKASTMLNDVRRQPKRAEGRRHFFRGQKCRVDLVLRHRPAFKGHKISNTLELVADSLTRVCMLR